MESDSGLARYSIIGFNPVAKIKAHDHNVTITTDTYTFEYTSDNPLLDIKTLIKNDFKEEGFRGGLLGYVSYESIKYFENVPTHKSIYPDFEFGLFLDCIVYDNIHKTCEYTTLNEDRSDLIKRIYQEEHTNGILEYKLIQEDFTQDEYENAVDETKNLITDGEIFQAVISNSENLVLKGSKLPLYEHLRKINPSPYMYYIKDPKFTIFGASPEFAVRFEALNRMVSISPIAGTRARGLDENGLIDRELDSRIELELRTDKKEVAEHLMLVDLARNDLARISKPGTRYVDNMLHIDKYQSVMHLVSDVHGTLQDDLDALHAYQACMNMGTLSGAPKIKAHELIYKYEGKKRGSYGGVIAILGNDGSFDSCIAIRSAFVKDKTAYVQAGCGVVFDSDIKAECQETVNKARSVLTALAMAQEK